jgi:hypothetical protein|eukprot:COSAG03_NODE_3324_length_2083_cov_1.855343_2_plen_223_part_00
MKAQMDAAVDKSRSVNGVPTSLAELGYDLIAMDDGWQKCNCSTRGDLDGSVPNCPANCMSSQGPGTGGGCSFHSNGSRGPVGTPVVDVRRFPDMEELVKYGHSLGLRVGSYLNNCICAEGGQSPTRYQQDVDWIVNTGFDGVKIDNCGSSQNTTRWAELFNKSGRPVQIESKSVLLPLLSEVLVRLQRLTTADALVEQTVTIPSMALRIRSSNEVAIRPSVR